MSVDPASAAAGAAGSAAASAASLEAQIAAELSALAADAQTLQAAVQIGDVVQAQVLPPNGLTDLLLILGNRVAAALPPTLTPGDTVTVQVTGFNGPQILLQLLSNDPTATGSGSSSAASTSSSAAQSPPAATPPLPAAPVAAPVSEGALAAAATNPLGDQLATPQIAPPVAVFVAASVQQPSAAPASSAQSAGPPAAEPGPNAPPSATPAPPPLPPVLGGIEARLAAARAGSVSVNVPLRNVPSLPPPPASALRPPVAQPPPAAGAAAANPGARIPQPATGAAGFVPPPIVTPARFLPAAASAPPAADPATAQPAAEASPAALARFADPLSLLRALQLPNTPANLASAKLALDAPQRIAAALATLDTALPASSTDPRIATLQTLTSFVAKLDPASPQLATQIAAYVDQVVAGGESKFAGLLAALAGSDPAQQAPAAAPAAAAVAAGETEAADDASPAAVADEIARVAAAGPPTEPALPVVAMAQVVARSAALLTDLKTQLLSLVNGMPRDAANSEVLAPAATSALTAVTAVQLNAAQQMAAAPQQISFALPMWVGNGYAQARIAIDRDKSNSNGAPLDGDNFHIAFVLDTKNIGTVAVDLLTVGRAFSLAVKTERPDTAKRFAGAIERLTTRLETLRYKVNSAEAFVAPPTMPAPAADAAPPDEPVDPRSTVNQSA